MKKVFFAILLLASTQLGAQTALYKAFLGKNGINACCIPDYPIGDKTTVTVTLLQADDSATFKTLMRSLKAMPYSKDKSGKRNKSANEFEQQLQRMAAGEENAEIDVLRHLMNLDVNIGATVTKSEISKNKWSFTSFRTDALRGDKGFYEVFHSTGTLTVLVFHCPDEDTVVKVFHHLLKQATRSR